MGNDVGSFTLIQDAPGSTGVMCDLIGRGDPFWCLDLLGLQPGWELVSESSPNDCSDGPVSTPAGFHLNCSTVFNIEFLQLHHCV